MVEVTGDMIADADKSSSEDEAEGIYDSLCMGRVEVRSPTR
jgi:hypothetical protein